MVETEATRSGLGGKVRPGLLVAGLSVVVLTVAVLQTAVVPVLGIIAHQLNASTVAASWAVTANLLAAAAATPLIGRLADLHSKKHVLLVVLAVVLLGSVLAATTSSLALLIIARVLQAASFALYPIGVAILREELTEDRMVSAMSVLSGTLGFGGGTGLVVVGLLMSGNAGYHRVFWLTTGFTLVVIAIVILIVPARPRSSTGTIDWLGAAGLAAGLSAVLLAITQGNSWGWTSPGDARLRGVRRGGARWLVVLGATRQAAAGVDRDADPAADHAHQPRHRVRRHGSVLRVPGADAVRPNPPRRSGIRLRGDRAGSQRRVPVAGCAHRLPGRVGQRALHRPIRCPAGARRSPRSRASWASCSSRSRIRRRGRSSPRASWPTLTSASVTARCPRWWSPRSTPARRVWPRA